MNVHISYKAAKVQDVEREINQQVAKLEKRLQVFRPELVHLHAILEQNSNREGIDVSLNLRLPSGQLAVQNSGATAVAVVKVAFSDLLAQVTKHKELLRGERQHRRRRLERQPTSVIPFEKTLAAVHPPTVSNGDVDEYLNANMAKLKRFVEREIRYREANGQIEPNLMTPEEVIDEAVAMALSDDEEKPEKLSLERWLYRLAIQAMRQLASANGEVFQSVPLQQSARTQNVRGSDEPQLQYHQPDEMMREEDIIADRRIATPESIVASDEMITQVEAVLLGASREEREAFILYAVEGFTVDEIAATTDRPADRVLAAIGAARERVRAQLPPGNVMRDKLLQHSKTA